MLLLFLLRRGIPVKSFPVVDKIFLDCSSLFINLHYT